jgi:serine/threonine-protein kinase
MGTTEPPLIVGRYAIYDKIASGAMATVHLGRLLGTAGFARTVAVKRLHPSLVRDPEFQATLIDEARLAARIHHPNVVQTLDIFAAEGELLLVMEYIRGESLARLLRAERAAKRHAPIPIVSAILVGVLSGLHAAHEATSEQGEPLGLVHRDVSPQNVLVGVDGLPRVIDFGVAKARGRLQTSEAGMIKGKLAYMAPEQLAAGTVTRVTDVYAASVVLWEALAGVRLFEGEKDGALLRRVITGVEDAPSTYAPDVPRELDALVMKGLSLDPSARFPSARDMAHALQRLVPPAFASEVGEWCAAAAKDALAARSELLAAVERSSQALELAPSDAGPVATRPPPPMPPMGGRGTVPPPARTATTPPPAHPVTVAPPHAAGLPVAEEARPDLRSRISRTLLSPPVALATAAGALVLFAWVIASLVRHQPAPAVAALPPPDASPLPTAPPPVPSETAQAAPPATGETPPAPSVTPPIKPRPGPRPRPQRPK